MAITQCPGYRAFLQRKNKDFEALAVLRRAMRPKAAEYLLNGARYLMWNLNSYAPRNTNSHIIMISPNWRYRGGFPFYILLFYTGRVDYVNGEAKSTPVGTWGNEALPREPKRWGENIDQQRDGVIRMALRVFEFAKLAAWVSRRTYPTAIRSSQSEVLCYLSDTIAKDISRCLFPEKAGPDSRRGENVKGKP